MVPDSSRLKLLERAFPPCAPPLLKDFFDGEKLSAFALLFWQLASRVFPPPPWLLVTHHWKKGETVINLNVDVFDEETDDVQAMPAPSTAAAPEPVDMAKAQRLRAALAHRIESYTITVFRHSYIQSSGPTRQRARAGLRSM